MNAGRPVDIATLFAQAAAHCQAGRWAAADVAVDQILAREPSQVRALGIKAIIAFQTRRLADAEALFRKIVAIQPDDAETHYNLGLVLHETGRLADAEAAYREALRLQPTYADAYNNLGNLFLRAEELDKAEAAYRMTLQLDPDHIGALNNLASLLAKTGRLEDAETTCRKTLALEPDHAGALSVVGDLLALTGRLESAEAAYRKAADMDPHNPLYLSSVIHVSQLNAHWSDLARDVSTLLKSLERTPDRDAALPFTTLAIPGVSAIRQRQFAQRFALNKCSWELALPPVAACRPHQRERRLRIGFVSPDFREHAVASVVAEVLEMHDRQRFELFAYSLGIDDGSPTRQRVVQAFEVFRDIRTLSNSEAASSITEDGIDILVDLGGYTRGTRPAINALRPAPVLVNWLGYAATLGHTRMADYLVGDPIATPLEHASHYSEKIAQMPHCYLPADRTRVIGEKPPRPALGLPHDAFVFCCFNRTYKLTPQVFDVWCRLLNAVPGSVLWLSEPESPAATTNLHAEARNRGVEAQRLIFAPKVPSMAAHLGRLQQADLALDTLPYTSHSTGSDALWAGLPMITCAGETFASRVGASQLRAVNLPELVTRNLKEYYRLALDMAMRRSRLQALRARLLQERLSAPLFDSNRFTRDLEQLYVKMWENHRGGTHRHIVARANT